MALKGPLANALAFVDANDNGTFDAGETSMTTSTDGAFSLANPGGHNVVIQTTSQTVDGASGATIDGLVLTGSSTDAVITPFTTILVENENVDMSSLATAMGLDGVDLATFNPYADGVDAADALAYEQTAQQVVAVLQVAGQALVANSNATQGEALTAVFDSIVTAAQDAIANGTELDLTDSGAVVDIVNETATEVGAATADVAAAAGQVAEINVLIDTVASLDVENDPAVAEIFSASTGLADLYESDPAAATQVEGGIVNYALSAINFVASVTTLDESTEDAPIAGAIVLGDLSADDAETVPVLSLSGDDAESFDIVNGQLVFVDGSTVNFEA